MSRDLGKRRFGGKTFHGDCVKDTKREAQEYADGLRKQGWLVRIVKTKTKYYGTVYAIYRYGRFKI